MVSTHARERIATAQELLRRRNWLYLRWGVVLFFMSVACGGGGCFACFGCLMPLNLACQACPLLGQGCQACPIGGCNANGLGGFPQQQRMQNAAQIRLTPEGLDFIAAQIPELVGDLVAEQLPVCVPAMEGEAGGLRYRACTTEMCNGQPGCRVDLTVGQVSLRSQVLDADASGRERAGVMADVVLSQVASDLRFQLDDGSDCALELRAASLPAAVPVSLSTPAPTRELSFDIGDAAFDLRGVGMRVYSVGANGGTCRQIDGQLNSARGREAVAEMVRRFMREAGPELLAVVDGVRCRTCDTDADCLTGGRCAEGQCLKGDACQVAPLGVSGELAVGELLPGVAPGNDAVMRLLAAFGGHVDARGGGLSIGLIGGATSRRHTVATPAPDTALFRFSGARMARAGRLLPGETASAEVDVERGGMHRVEVTLSGENPDAMSMRAAIRVDGDTVEVVNVTREDIADPQRAALHVELSAGSHTVEVRFLDEFLRGGTGVDQAVHVGSLEVEGPLEVLEGAHPCVSAQPRPPIVEGTRSPALEGSSDPKGRPYHLALSISRPWIDQHLWAAYDSGALCLGVSSHVDEKLRLLGANIPGLKRLTGSENAPIAVTLAPQAVPGVVIGDHLTEIDDDGAAKLVEPLATFELPALWIDFHTLVEDRWVRIFSVQADVALPTGLGFTPDDTFRLAVGDVVVANLRTENAELLGDDLAELEALLPGVLGPLVGGFVDTLMAPVQLPEVMGFAVNAQDGLLVGVDDHTSMGLFFDLERRPMGGSGARASVETEVEVLEVHVPERAAWTEDPPWVRLKLEAWDGSGDEGVYAFSWRVGQGPWSPFTTAEEVTLRRPELLWQGRHRIEVQAKRVDDYRSLDPSPAVAEVIVDVQPPELLVEAEGDAVTVAARDHVSPERAIRLEWRATEADEWRPLEDVVVGRDVAVAVRAVDEAGNVSQRWLEGAAQLARAEVEGDERAPAGCSAVPGGGGPAPWGLAVVVLLFAARRWRWLAVVALLGCGDATMVSTAGGSATAAGGKAPGAEAPGGEAAGGEAAALEVGSVGRHSDFAVLEGEVVFAAYAEAWGDLVLGDPEGGWAFVDGVPEGPVTGRVSGPRGGVSGAGDDVGRHVRVQTDGAGVVHVAYHDVTSDALRYARRDGGAWSVEVLDEGGAWLDLAMGPEGPVVAYRAGGEVRVVRPGGEPRVVGAAAEVDGVGLGVALAMDGGEAVVAWHDAATGSLKVARGGEVETVVEGGGAFVDVAVDGDGRLQLCFQDADTHGLRYAVPAVGRAEWIDDGVRGPGGRGHLVGADCVLRFDGEGLPVVAYQDATAHEVWVARRAPDGRWGRSVVGGGGAEYAGSYGFATRARVVEGALWVSTWVVDAEADRLELIEVPLPALVDGRVPAEGCEVRFGQGVAPGGAGFARVDAGAVLGLACADPWMEASCRVEVAWARGAAEVACPAGGPDGACARSDRGEALRMGALAAGDRLAVGWRCEDARDPERAARATAAVEVFLGWAPAAEAPADGAESWAACPARSRGSVDGQRCVGSRGDGGLHPMEVPEVGGVLGIALSSRG